MSSLVRSLLFFGGPLLLLPVSLACGGAGSKPAQSGQEASAEEIKEAKRPCGKADHVHDYDLHDEDGDESLVPCSQAGERDYAGHIHIETRAEGVHITIHATDEEVNTGELGSDVKTRDAVLVYPKGPGTEGVEVPLRKVKGGYIGEKTVLWDQLGKITDEGTKIDVAVFDHDKSSGKEAEELHVAVKVSAGMSCEKARDANPDTLDMSKKAAPDLTDAELGAPFKDTAFLDKCGLADSAHAKICVAVKGGKPLGVSVGVTPASNRAAACIDKAVRKMHFPASEKLDMVNESF